MPPTDPLPTPQEIEEGKAKVVIFKPDESGVALAGKANVGHSIATTLEQVIAITGTEIVDRGIAQKLKQEIQLSEMKGLSAYQGPNVADYAITGTISTVNAGAKYTAASEWTDKKGEVHYVSARCKYTAQVAANLRIYKLPELSFLQTISIEDRASASEDTRGSHCPQTDSAKAALIRKAASDAVDDVKLKFQNYFAPKAFVIERRVREQDSIFKLSKGTAAGFEFESEATFYHLDKSYNALTQKTTFEEYDVVEGVVSNLIGESHAWVLVDDAEKANQIKLGDYVKVTYESCTWCDLVGGVKAIVTGGNSDMMGSGGAGSSQAGAPQSVNLVVSEDVEEVDAEWNWTANKFENRLGQDFAYTCPSGGTIYRIWGTDKYQTDSSVCSAAVHAGLFSARAGGIAVIRITSNKKLYKSTHRNGVQSVRRGDNYMRHNLSFVFLR